MSGQLSLEETKVQILQIIKDATGLQWHAEIQGPTVELMLNLQIDDSNQINAYQEIKNKLYKLSFWELMFGESVPDTAETLYSIKITVRQTLSEAQIVRIKSALLPPAPTTPGSSAPFADAASTTGGGGTASAADKPSRCVIA